MLDVPDNCDVCGRNSDELTQHCHISTGVRLNRAHFLCDDCLLEFPIPDRATLIAEGVSPDLID